MGEDSVTATVNYIARTVDKPYVHTAALTGGLPRYFADFESHNVTIRNARPNTGHLSLDREGFALVRHESTVADFYDDTSVKSHYYPEVEALLRTTTGAREVYIFDHTRRVDDETVRGTAREPAGRIHNDYTEKSAPQRVRDLLGTEQTAIKTIRPYAQINIWRPIRGPVQRSPLALLDASSLADGDLVATDQIYPDRTGEIYHLAWNPQHRWWYFPSMETNEVVLIKGYDSRLDGRARFTPHTAFEDPETPPRARPRESIEIRAFVFFSDIAPEAAGTP